MFPTKISKCVCACERGTLLVSHCVYVCVCVSVFQVKDAQHSTNPNYKAEKKQLWKIYEIFWCSLAHIVELTHSLFISTNGLISVNSCHHSTFKNLPSVRQAARKNIFCYISSHLLRTVALVLEIHQNPFFKTTLKIPQKLC